MIRQNIAAIFLLFLAGVVRAQTTRSFPTPEELAKQIIANSKENRVQRPEAYEPAGPALARLCQSDPFFFLDEPDFAPAWTPPSVLRLKPSWVQISPEGARVEFGGGFHHFGYNLSLDKSVNGPGISHWKMIYYDEDSPDKLLVTFTLKKTDHVDRDAFISGAVHEFRRRAMQDENSERQITEAIIFLMKFDRVAAARQFVHECAAANPHDWADQLLSYMVDSKRDPTAAKNHLEAWGKKMGDFSAWLMAAYACNLTGHNNEAERCVKFALSKPVDEPDWCPNNVRYRGATVCAQLLNARHYATCAALCGALLAYSADGDYLAAEIKAIRKSASNATLNGRPPAPPHFAEGTVFEPFKGIDLARLASAPATRASADSSKNGNDRLLDYYEHRIEAEPSQSNYATKIDCLVSIHRRPDAIMECQRAAHAFPNWWLPPMAFAVLSDGSSRQRAATQFHDWVRKHPSFIHWWYCSRYDRDQGNTAAAISDLQKAVKYPLEMADQDENWTPQGFAYDAATFAYEQKRYELVMQIADVWSHPRGIYNYVDNDVFAFRAAAELGQAKFEEAKRDADTVVAAAAKQAIWAGNLTQLQQAAQREDQNFVYQPGMACGGHWQLFQSP